MSVDHKILRWIETEIFEGNLALGEDLPDDRLLAETIKAGHNSTREALKRLETMGIVRLYEGKRKAIIASLVSEPVSAMAPALRLHMAAARYPLRDLVQTRLALEPWALGQAQLKEGSLAGLTPILEKMQEPTLAPADFHQLEVDFHIALVALAENQLLLGLVSSLRESMQEYLLSLMGLLPLWSATATRLKAEYKAIYDALNSGDRELAQQLLRANIERQYQEAEIDLDQATGVANELPGVLAAIEPVEVDTEDLIPEQWEEPVSVDLIHALENIEGTSSPAIKAPSQVGEAGSRRRRGTVSVPVKATVIAPINRSGSNSGTGVISGQVPSKSQRALPQPKRVQTEQEDKGLGKQISHDTLRAKPRPEKLKEAEKLPEIVEPAENLVGARQEEVERKQSVSARFGRWLGIIADKSVQAQEPSSGELTADVEAEEAQRRKRLETLKANKSEENPEALASATAEQDARTQREEDLPSGYEYADSQSKEPEIIDQSAPDYRQASREEKEDAGSVEGKVHRINKNVKKKKKRRR